MFNNMRRCLTISVGIDRKFLTRSIHEGVLSPKFRFSSVNATCSNNAVYKRHYCHATNEQNLTSAELSSRNRQLKKQELDEFLSNPENNKRFQLLELEVDVMRHNAAPVPNNIEPKDWLTLLNLNTRSMRGKYLKFLWINEKKEENRKAKKELKNAEWLAKKEQQDAEEDTGEMKYGLLHNSLFMRIYKTTMQRYYNGKLIQNMMFDPKIVFDCSYENNMTPREIHNCAKQLCIAFAENRTHVNPLCLYFCNFNQEGLLKQRLYQNIPTLLDDDFPAEITSQSYLDVFPKDQLVYLTPHCKVNMTEYDPDMIYIIGALVDKGDSHPLSLAKAKREGIRMAKFPIEKYLDWGCSSSKNLTLDQSLKIMLDLRHTGDWKEALKHVPIRKLRSSRENVQHRMQRFTLNTLETRKPKIQSDFTFQSRKIN